MGKKNRNSKKKGGETGKNKNNKAVDMFNTSNWLVQREKNEKYGNYFVAKEDIKEGTLIGMDMSILQVFVDPSVCVECGSMMGNKPTYCPHHEGKCEQVYCSKECQERAWSHFHCVQDGPRLGRLVKYCKRGFTNTRLGLLIICKLIALYKVNSMDKNMNAEFVAFCNTLLETHVLPPMMEEIQGKDVRVIDMVSVFDTTQIFIAPNGDRMMSCPLAELDFSKTLPLPFHSVGEIRKADSLIMCYAFGSLDDMSLMGATNWFNHSCVPNATVSVTNTASSITAMKDIAKGEQVFICYFDLENTPAATRREALEMQHGFVCTCDLCIADEETPSCVYCGCRPEKLRTCTRCRQYQYCGRDCQAAHWPKHKKYCNKSAKLTSELMKKSSK